MEQRLLGGELSEDGPGAPDVDGGGVAGRAEEDLWSPVPKGHNLAEQTKTATK